MSAERFRINWRKGDFVSRHTKHDTILLLIQAGDKIKEQREETARKAENERKAGSSYASPEPEALDNDRTLSGLPWGGISMKHIVETGKSKEQASQQSSRETSVYDGASSNR